MVKNPFALSFFFLLLIPFLTLFLNGIDISFGGKLDLSQKTLQEKDFQIINNQNLIIKGMENQGKLLSQIVKDKINEAVVILELTSKKPSIKNTLFEKNISKDFKGIAENLDTEKRDIAKDIIKSDIDIKSIYFVLPNGDIYLGEPYKDQKQLSRLNFADRDWYKGVSSLNDTYISSVFISAAIHVPATAIAVPIYEDINTKLLGYWVGIIDLDSINKQAELLYNKNNTQFIVLDHYGNALVDTNKDLIRTILNSNVNNITIKNNNLVLINASSHFNKSLITTNNTSSSSVEINSYNDLEIVKNVLSGKSGKIFIETDKQKYAIIYYPIQIGSHIWAVILSSMI